MQLLDFTTAPGGCAEVRSYVYCCYFVPVEGPLPAQDGSIALLKRRQQAGCEGVQVYILARASHLHGPGFPMHEGRFLCGLGRQANDEDVR